MNDLSALQQERNGRNNASGPSRARSLKAMCIAAAIIALFSGISHAGTYYVTPTGSATWAECADISTPCPWQTAAAQAIADDVVYFRGGTYEVEAECGSWQDVAMNPANSGSPGHPITFIAYPGETAAIKACTGDVTAAAFGAHGRSYIIWDGFHASMTAHPGGTAWLAYFYQATGSIIRNSHFTSVPYSDYHNNAPIIIETSDDNEVYNNHIEGCSGTGTNTAGVWIFNSDNSKVYQNTITNCANGIMQKDGPNNNIELYNNFINVTAVGMNLNEQFAATGGLKVHNNVIMNASVGINLDGTSDALTLNGYEVYNNTIYGGAMSILASPYNRSLSLWNNLLVSPGTRLLVFSSGTAGAALPVYSDHNGFFGNSVWNVDWSTNYTSLTDWRAATPYDDNSVTTDPGFVNAGGTTPDDYQRTSYPANGRGGSYAPVMGAYITGSELIGYQGAGVAFTYTIGGMVTGLTGTLILQNNGGDDITITADGTYTFLASMETGSAYSVTVLTQPVGMTCVVNNASGTVASANITNANVSCTLLAQCSDGIDNDGDGFIDMSDPGCSSASDNDETDAPVGQNAAPTAPTLVSPANGAAGLGTTVEFRWKKSTDPDGDAVTYQLHNCVDPGFSGCAPVAAAMNSKIIFFAGGAGLFMVGMMFIGGLTGKKQTLPLLVIVVLLAGGALVSCSKKGGDGDDEGVTLPADEMSHTVSSLSPGTTYYWKVVADDGKGGTTESAVWSYGTQ